jgi:hypothetical protein
MDRASRATRARAHARQERTRAVLARNVTWCPVVPSHPVAAALVGGRRRHGLAESSVIAGLSQLPIDRGIPTKGSLVGPLSRSLRPSGYRCDHPRASRTPLEVKPGQTILARINYSKRLSPTERVRRKSSTVRSPGAVSDISSSLLACRRRTLRPSARARRLRPSAARCQARGRPRLRGEVGGDLW